MNIPLLVILTTTLFPVASLSQTQPGTIPAGTPLALGIDRHLPMRAGQPISGRLLYPIYADNRLLLPRGTVVAGRVVDLLPDHSRRVRSILGGDFTPFHIPKVQFTQIQLPDGTAIPLNSGTAASGTQIYRAVAPPPARGGFFRREFNSGLSAARTDVAYFTAPGKADRLLQFLYARLPYHPQRIEKGTSWSVETTAVLEIPAQPAAHSMPTPTAARKLHFWDERSPAPPPPANDTGTWIVQANLSNSISSETSSNGQTIRALVADPVYNPDHTLAVPQGATLLGVVTRAKPARRFGRTGVLSFSFSQLTLSDAETQTVETRLTGVDSAQDIALNSEGQAKSKPQDKIMVPLFLALLAARPLDNDHHDGGGNQFGKNGVGGAAGLGLLGTVIGLAGGSPYAAAGIGYWGAARVFYSRWIARGQKIAFAQGTRIVVETTPRRSAPMTPNPPPNPPPDR